MLSKKWLVVVVWSLLSSILIILPASAAEDPTAPTPSEGWWSHAIDTLELVVERVADALSGFIEADTGTITCAPDLYACSDGKDAGSQQFGGAVIPNG